MIHQYHNKNCQNCKNDFIIESDDFSFYKKIKVPPPTFCPECRMIRRVAWRNEITIKSEDLPDHIKDITDEIINQIISCPNSGNELTQCAFAYKIHTEELTFLKNHKIALPRYCPSCRHYKRLSQRNPLKLWHRQCMKEGCPNEFETSYTPDRPEIVYCEKCYQQEVY